jgi:chromosome segregation ATPase
MCKHCKNNSHNVANKKCPKYIRETEIQHIRVDQGIGYPAARRMWEAQHGNESTAVVVGNQHEDRLNILNAKMEQISNELKNRNTKIEEMSQEIHKKIEQITKLFDTLAARDAELVNKDKKIAELEQKLQNLDKNLQPTSNKGNLPKRLIQTRESGTIADLIAENNKLKEMVLSLTNKTEQKVIQNPTKSHPEMKK